jgi:hypothetical protein
MIFDKNTKESVIVATKSIEKDSLFIILSPFVSLVVTFCSLF